jgi:hypothetical protein
VAKKLAGPHAGAAGEFEHAPSRTERLKSFGQFVATWQIQALIQIICPESPVIGGLLINVLVADGRLAGVIDVGGLGPADPALDLVGAWHLLETGPREVLREALGCDDREWERGQAWAFAQAMGLVWYYITSNPTMSFNGRRTLDRLLQVR